MSIQVILITTTKNNKLLFRTDTQEVSFPDNPNCAIKVDRFEITPPNQKELVIDWSAFDLLFTNNPEYAELADAITPGISSRVQNRASLRHPQESVLVDVGLPKIKLTMAGDIYEADIADVKIVNVGGRDRV